MASDGSNQGRRGGISGVGDSKGYASKARWLTWTQSTLGQDNLGNSAEARIAGGRMIDGVIQNLEAGLFQSGQAAAGETQFEEGWKTISAFSHLAGNRVAINKRVKLILSVMECHFGIYNEVFGKSKEIKEDATWKTALKLTLIAVVGIGDMMDAASGEFDIQDIEVDKPKSNKPRTTWEKALKDKWDNKVKKVEQYASILKAN